MPVSNLQWFLMAAVKLYVTIVLPHTVFVKPIKSYIKFLYNYQKCLKVLSKWQDDNDFQW